MTSLIGGNTSGMGPSRSKHFSNHCSRSAGMFEGWYSSFFSLVYSGFRNVTRDPVVFFVGGRVLARVFLFARIFTVAFVFPVGLSGLTTLDLAGSTFIEPAISSHVDVDGEGSILPFPFKGAVSLGGGHFPPLTGLLELTHACSSSKVNTLICVPFIWMVWLPKSRHTPYVFMNGVLIMQSYRSIFTKLKYSLSLTPPKSMGTLVP